MNEIVVHVERTQNGFVAFGNEKINIKEEASNLDLLKKKVNTEIAYAWYNTVDKHAKDSKSNYPKVKYCYNVKKLLLDIHPLVKHKTLAKYSGITYVTLSYYMNGHKNCSEEYFLRLIHAIGKISCDLMSYSNAHSF